MPRSHPMTNVLKFRQPHLLGGNWGFTAMRRSCSEICVSLGRKTLGVTDDVIL